MNLFGMLREATIARLINWRIIGTTLVNKHSGELMPIYEATIDGMTVKLFAGEARVKAFLFTGTRQAYAVEISRNGACQTFTSDPKVIAGEKTAEDEVFVTYFAVRDALSRRDLANVLRERLARALCTS